MGTGKKIGNAMKQVLLSLLRVVTVSHELNVEKSVCKNFHFKFQFKLLQRVINLISITELLVCSFHPT